MDEEQNMDEEKRMKQQAQEEYERLERERKQQERLDKAQEEGIRKAEREAKKEVRQAEKREEQKTEKERQYNLALERAKHQPKQPKVVHVKAPVYRGYGGHLANRYGSSYERQFAPPSRNTPEPRNPYGNIGNTIPARNPYRDTNSRKIITKRNPFGSITSNRPRGNLLGGSMGNIKSKKKWSLW